MKKYVICPGTVVSCTDGQRHYISAKQLMRLYSVRVEECEIYEPVTWWSEFDYRMAQERVRGLIKLHPRYDGNYTIPKGN